MKDLKPLLYPNPLRAALVALVLIANASTATCADYSARSVSQLIDDLTFIDAPVPGIDGGSIYKGFIGNNTPGLWIVGVLGVPAPSVPPQMVELVRRGPVALPELLKHLSDARPTKLEVGNKPRESSSNQVGVDTFMFTLFSDEYDPRVIGGQSGKTFPSSLRKDFQGRYTVKVGDVCFALIGQIVNRQLYTARYQPSGGLVVNSPVEVPALAAQVLNEWQNTDAESLRASLMADIRAADKANAQEFARYRASGALVRLRIYFPDAYNSLQGADLQAKKSFEEQEAKEAKKKE